MNGVWGAAKGFTGTSEKSFEKNFFFCFSVILRFVILNYSKSFFKLPVSGLLNRKLFVSFLRRVSYILQGKNFSLVFPPRFFNKKTKGHKRKEKIQFIRTRYGKTLTQTFKFAAILISFINNIVSNYIASYSQRFNFTYIYTHIQTYIYIGRHIFTPFRLRVKFIFFFFSNRLLTRNQGKGKCQR